MSYEIEVRRLREQVGDLIAKHERARDVAEFSRYADDPAGFMRDVLRCEPWQKQLEMAELVRDHPRTVVVTANGIGKDWVTARLALWWVYARRGLVILTGPTERQVKQILMRELRKAFALAPELPGELYSLELRVDDTGECAVLAFTSDNPDRLTGFHHPRLLICVTEGQGVDDAAYEAIQACATAPGNRVFVYGNPTRPTGPFYRAAHAAGWHTLRIAASEHPNVVEGREVIPGAVSREWIAAVRDEYGEGSSFYRARVLAEFPENSIEGLIRRDWLRAAFARFESAGPDLRTRPLLSLDVARFGPDASVLAVLQGPVVRELIRWRGASTTTTVDRVLEEIARVEREWRCLSVAPDELQALRELGFSDSGLTVVVDEPGLGGGAIDLLRARGVHVRAFNGGSQAQDSSRFLNTRAESHWHFRNLLEAGKVALPADLELEEEVLAVEWQINSQGKVQIVSKDTIRATLGRSPDKLDAIVMGLVHSVGIPGREWREVRVVY